jgi:hypothetical protein
MSDVLVRAEPSGHDAGQPDLTNVGTFELRRAIHHRRERSRERGPQPPVPRGEGTDHPQPGPTSAPGPTTTAAVGPLPPLPVGRR